MDGARHPAGRIAPADARRVSRPRPATHFGAVAGGAAGRGCGRRAGARVRAVPPGLAGPGRADRRDVPGMREIAPAPDLSRYRNRLGWRNKLGRAAWAIVWLALY